MSTRCILCRAVAALASSALLLPAAASAEPQLLVPLGSGLTTPAGIARTPDGAIWVADHVRGICRVSLGSPPGLVETAYCGPVDGPHAGPVKPTGLAFDAQTSNLYASDGASSGGAVWRMHWRATSGTIDSAARVVSLPDDRIGAIALGPETVTAAARDLYFVTKRSAAIMRLSAVAGAPQAPVAVGFAQSPAPLAVAWLDGALYLAEGTAVTRLAVEPEGDGVAAPVPALAGALATSLIADAARHRLYAGTSDPDLRDRVEVLDATTGEAETYETGFTGLTALGVEPDGSLLAADDPGGATGAIDSLDQGRLWRVAPAPLRRPSVRITSAPAAVGASRSVMFAYASRAAATFECRMGDAPFGACPGMGSGSTAYDGLAEGPHRFTVRAVDGVSGTPVVRAFVVDATPPRVRIAPPAGAFVAGAGAPAVQFSADEDYVAFTCSVNGGPFKACQPGDPLEGLAAGTHVLRVAAVDAAGNASEAPATVTFHILEPARPGPAWASGDTAPDTGGSRPAGPAQVAPGGPKPILRPFRLRPTRMQRPRTARGSRPLVVLFDAPASAVSVRLAVVDARGRAVLTRTEPVHRAAPNRIAVRLSRRDLRRLRPGLYLVTAVLGGAPGVAGNPQTHWLRILPRR